MPRDSRNLGPFWQVWAEENSEHNTGRGARGARRERAQRWREHFNNYMGDYPEQHWLFGGRRFRPWHYGRAGYNPFIASVLSMGGGLLPVLVLRLIAEEPRYGNEIMKLIARETGGKWLANPGAVYPLLSQMEDEGLITGAWDDPQKRTTRVYEITAEGTAELQRLTAVMQPKLAEAAKVLSNIETWLTLPVDAENNHSRDT